MAGKEQQLATDMFAFFDDPLSFVLYTFPWGKKGTVLEHFPEGPDQWHVDMFTSMSKHIRENMVRQKMGQDMIPYKDATASGHGIGKSACVAWVILWLMSTRRYTRGVVTANTGNQLEEKTWPELAKWHNLAINKHWFKWTATKFYCVLYPDGEKNWKFDCVPWSEERTEAFAGLHNASGSAVMIFDEASAIPDVIWEVSEGAMTDGEPFWFAFGNPTRNTGRFRECFGKFRHRWETRHVDSRSVRITNKKFLQDLIDDYGEDSDFCRVRVKGQFPRAGDKQFFPIDMIETAQGRTIGREEGQVFSDPGAPLILGVDVARFGGDKCVLRFRQGLDGQSIKPLKYVDIEATDLADRIAEAIDKFRPDAVNIDSGGGGAQVHDILKRMGYQTRLVNFGTPEPSDSHCANKRSLMYHDVREWLKMGAIDKDQDLYDDLIGPEYKFDKHQRYLIESKDDMRKRGLASQDDLDAFALTFAFPIARKDMRTSRRARGRVMTAQGMDYDVFS
jgi:hypothetical protein